MRRFLCIMMMTVLFMVFCSASFAELSDVVRLQALQEEQEALYYSHLGQWFSILNRIYQTGHKITKQERNTFRQLFTDLLNDVRDIVQTCADGDAEYWTYLFKADNLDDMNQEDFDIYAGIIEKTYNSFQTHQEQIDKLKASTDGFWEISSKYDHLDRELYERAMFIIKELDNIIHELHPSKELAENTQ